MKLHILSLFLILIISCKEKPTYDPFDGQYNIAVNELVKDNCDTISAGCGYFNLIERSGKLKTYYQISNEDPSEVVAKGFNYVIDSFEIQKDIRLRVNDPFRDSIRDLPMDEHALNNELNLFDYKLYTKKSDTIFIVNNTIKDTIKLSIEVASNEIDRFRIYRVVNYYTDPVWDTRRMMLKND